MLLYDSIQRDRETLNRPAAFMRRAFGRFEAYTYGPPPMSHRTGTGVDLRNAMTPQDAIDRLEAAGWRVVYRSDQ